MLTVTPASAREQHLPGDFPPPPRNPPAEFAWRALEEVDFGMALVLPEGQLQHANHLARHEICTGRRQLVMLQDGKDTLPVACVPLEAGFETRSAPVLLMLGRRAESQRLAITFFARSHGLTPAEENVLRGLCAGHAVQDIANANGTTEGTVRTQIRTLREKTAAPSIRVLLQRVAALPPVVPVSLAGAQAPADGPRL
jgi:DNA-binding CsgD family transcriptional regulator